MYTVNAIGDRLPGVTVYKNLRFPPKVAANQPESFMLGRSDNGWMTSEVFYEYIVNGVLPHLKEQKLLPAVMFLDSHSSHLSSSLMEICSKEGLHLIAFYENSTHILQMLDIGVFRGLKNAYKKIARNKADDGECVTKETFAQTLEEACKIAVTEQVI